MSYPNPPLTQNPNKPFPPNPKICNPNAQFSHNPNNPFLPNPNNKQPNPQFTEKSKNPFPRNHSNPNSPNQNVQTKPKPSTRTNIDEQRTIDQAKMLYKARTGKDFKYEHWWRMLKDEPLWKEYIARKNAEGLQSETSYTSSSNPDSKDEDEDDDEEAQIESDSESVLKLTEEVLKGLEGFETAQMMKSPALQEQATARALEFTARVKQRELDLQVLYKDTSSLSPQQFRLHKLMLDEISRRLESEK